MASPVEISGSSSISGRSDLTSENDYGGFTTGEINFGGGVSTWVIAIVFAAAVIIVWLFKKKS